MYSTQTLHPDSLPESWPGVAAGLVIFLISGLALILNELPLGFQLPAWAKNINNLVFWCIIFTPVVGTSVGWIKGFPRWSYPYVPMAVLLALYLVSTSTPGVSFFGYPTFGRQLWGLRACLPLLLGTGFAWLVTRSSRSIHLFIAQMGQDHTLATYALLGTLPLVIFIAYDEMDRAYSLRDMIVLSGLILLLALIYLRGRSLHLRSLILSVGVMLVLGFTAISTTAYWLSLGPENVYIPGMLIWTLILIAFYLSPMFLTRFVKSVSSSDALT